ncbi:TPA: hypothetical protein DDW35_06080 [Candidatus Sumerlaeota bacterium]|jgi:hypothetical protein|nr:hypothetical protein [Candidatus Sumerlaeota bacterium]
MQEKDRSRSVYIALIVLWLLLLLSQAVGHWRAIDYERQKLLDRAKLTSNTVAVVVRSQERFRIISQTRLESALHELIKSPELHAVAMLNQHGQVVASAVAPAGDISGITTETLGFGKPIWLKKSVIYPTLVDLGERFDNAPTTQSQTSTIIFPQNPPRRGEDMTSGTQAQRQIPPRDGMSSTTFRNKPQPPRPDDEGGNNEEPPPPRLSNAWDGTTSGSQQNIPPFPRLGEAPRPGGYPGREGDPTINDIPTSGTMDGEHRSPNNNNNRNFPRLHRPPWMNQEEYDALIQKQGLYGFALEIDTVDYQTACNKDLVVRILICGLAGFGMLGLALAWRNMQRNNRLQIRLIRASEINTHLKEMNVAAAGLAHETRNPLNIIRGLAQLTGRLPQADDEIRAKTTTIAEEVDRITGRLNEFIQYSRPPEPHPTPLDLAASLRDIIPALEADLEDKHARFELVGESPRVMADESLLRQVLFNLLMNSIQAIPEGGYICATICPESNGEMSLMISDNGPGITRENMEQIFRPYFTTRAEGTGLGLAVVRQIVLAHQWEIQYNTQEGGGACFTIRGIKIA